MNKILIGIINNREYVPASFIQSLLGLLEYTRKHTSIVVQEFKAVEVQQMRNNCCLFALNGGFDYIYMVDTDMTYPNYSIVELLKHNKEFVVGSATQRNPPFYPTQYKKLNAGNFKSKENRVFITEDDTKLVEIEATGVVGALIKVSCLRDLAKPYFKVEYKENGIDVIGSDVYFCKKWADAGKKIYLDPTINYEHKVLGFSNSFGVSFSPY